MKNVINLFLTLIFVIGFSSIIISGQQVKKGLVVNGQEIRPSTPQQQDRAKPVERKEAGSSSTKGQEDTQTSVPIQLTAEEAALLNNKPLNGAGNSSVATDDNGIQINGKQNKYGADDITDADLATLRGLEINSSASFFINGSDGSLTQSDAPKESELALAAKEDPRSKKTPDPAVNARVDSSDLINIAAGTMTPRMKKVITTTTYTTVILPGRIPATNPGKLLGTGRGITPQIAQWIIYYGNKHGVDPLLILEVMRQESQFKPFARSPVGAAGLMQFMPATAARFGINPLDPEQAIRGGAMYLSFLLRRYGGNIYSALAGYNAGEGAVDCYLTGRTLRLSNGKVINRSGMRTMHGIPPYAETQNYVRVITSRYFASRQAYAN